ncbi:MAG: cobyric acid synthase [Dehalococcoidia bacterium]|jgi:adenosylcobyric acid synthase|nr:cobyric acid synthase [Dehalococcoidia bacterium]MDP7239954.1 cobyric acid synthase [Dehalococcoidia bacterium]MDP7469866.1 cobyric acid synthase [Dehalococcoidia bacterium]
MVQGTGSGVGKSILAAALCRILHEDGLRVAPFKSQNMSLNSFVTRDGGEMGRAQVVQAQAAGVEPQVAMNPVLIKPERDARSQVVVMGRPWKTLSAADYYRHTPTLWSTVAWCLDSLMSSYDVVVIEGAGSSAEINLRRFEIVNMRVATHARAPVLLVGDIDKGGVFASLFGTLKLIEAPERRLVKGLIINKFRGDIAILKPGVDTLEGLTRRPVLGVVPYMHDIMINEEDSIHHISGHGQVDIAVIHLPRISNSTDFEPLQQEAGVRLRYVGRSSELGTPDLIILPGTKSTVADLLHLRENGLAGAITKAARREGTPVLGICGGFQMLGQDLADPHGVESQKGSSCPGLGLLSVRTVFETAKSTHQAKGELVASRGLWGRLKGYVVEGYEIHMGHTTDEAPPALQVRRHGERQGFHPDGAVDARGKVMGTYLHGIFDQPGFRHALIQELRRRKGLPPEPQSDIPANEENYRRLAAVVRESLDMSLLYEVCGLSRPKG